MSMKVCLDASAALAFVLPDDRNHAKAKLLLGAFITQGVTFCSPSLFIYECDSTISLRVWKEVMTEADAKLARAALDELPVEIGFDPTIRDRAYQISRAYDQPRCYDSTYAAFAEALEMELITTDEPFFEAVNGSKRPKNAPPLKFVRLLGK